MSGVLCFCQNQFVHLHMPKTINSNRNPLSMEEKAIYNVNLKVLQNIRMQMNDRYPSLPYTYNRIFTEAQAGGVCRMKFWQMTWENIIILEKWCEKVYGRVPFISWHKEGYSFILYCNLKH